MKLGILLAAAAFLVAPGAAQAADPRLAAVQVALRAEGLYAGTIDGVAGPQTTGAVRTFQRRAGLAADGVPGPKTARAIGPGRLRVAELQFLLASHGFPSGTLDGVPGTHTDAALRRFQRWAGLAADGVAGPATMAALGAPAPRAPISLAWPLHARVGDPFGTRGGRFHSGIDLVAPSGTGVAAAGPGTVTWAGYLPGGWGLLVTIAHGRGVRTLYAHLSRVDVHVGERVQAGFQVGLVGATGDATGPHLHFELRVRGAAVDPLPAFR